MRKKQYCIVPAEEAGIVQYFLANVAEFVSIMKNRSLRKGERLVNISFIRFSKIRSKGAYWVHGFYMAHTASFRLFSHRSFRC